MWNGCGRRAGQKGVRARVPGAATHVLARPEAASRPTTPPASSPPESAQVREARGREGEGEGEREKREVTANLGGPRVRHETDGEKRQKSTPTALRPTRFDFTCLTIIFGWMALSLCTPLHTICCCPPFFERSYVSHATSAPLLPHPYLEPFLALLLDLDTLSISTRAHHCRVLPLAITRAIS